MSKSPFKFLDSYTKQDKDLYFGRENEIEELYQKIFESKLLLVYGVSGTGKTSLINCGLANKFNDSDWLPIYIRRGKNLIQSLSLDLARIEGLENDFSSEKKLTTKQIIKQIKNIYLDNFKPVYLIFDQMEELFIFGEEDERNEFIQTIKAINDSELQCKVLMVIREEYLAELTEFEKEIPDILKNRIRVERMSRKNAEQVISGPCQISNIELEDQFAKSLIEKLSSNRNYVELTYLQVYLDKVYRSAIEKNKGSVQFSLSILEQLGDVSDLLGDFLDEQISQMEDPDTALSILKSFVSIKGTKKQIKEEDVEGYLKTFGKDSNRTSKYLQTFIKLRILKEKDDNGNYELRHDALAAKIYEKITVKEKELFEVKEFIENSYYTYIKRNVLLTTKDFLYIDHFLDKLSLNDGINEFINKSKQFDTRKKRTINRITQISIASFILLMFVIGRFLFISYNSYESKSIVGYATNQIINQKQLNKKVKKAYAKNQNALTIKAIYYAYYKQELSIDSNYYNYPITLIKTIKANSNIYYLSYNQNGKRIIFCTKDSVNIYGLNGKKIKSFAIPIKDILSVQEVNKNKMYFIKKYNGIIELLDSLGNLKFTLRAKTDNLNSELFANYLEEKNQLYIVNANNELINIDLEGNVIQVISNDESEVTSFDVSKNGQFIAVSQMNQFATIYYFNNVKKKYELYHKFKIHNDTIWSVRFSKWNQHILTASADSTIQIHTINGDRTMLFNYYEGEDHPKMNSKYCLALFSKSERDILFRTYVHTNRGIEFNHFYYQLYRSDWNHLSEQSFNSFDLKNEVNLLINEKEKTINLQLNYADLELYKLNGNKALLTSNEEFLITASDSLLFLYPLQKDTMINYLY